MKASVGLSTSKFDCDGNTELLSIQNATVIQGERFGNHFQLMIPALNLARGDRLAIVGLSGSGKTTALLAMAGFLTTSSGQLNFLSVNNHPPSHNRQIIFQGTSSLFWWMTVRENLLFAIGRSDAPSHAKADAFLDRAGLGAYANRWPRELSGGMQKRLEVARALAAEPDVLLCDETLQSLDTHTKLAIIEFIHEMQAEIGFGLVSVSHDFVEASIFCDRLALVKDASLHDLGKDGQSLINEIRHAHVSDKKLLDLLT